jgi:hypothetical protein
MAHVTVFVDDAVLGRLPPVCVKDGVRTTDRLTFAQDVSGPTGLGVAWLLVLAGPLGWIGLFVISAIRSGGGGLLTVTVPFSEAAYQRGAAAQRARRHAGFVFAGAAIAALLALLLRTTDGRLLTLGLAVVAGGALIKVIMESVRLSRLAVRVSLDASRRWVTLSAVHPNFVDSVQHDGHNSHIDSTV